MKYYVCLNLIKNNFILIIDRITQWLQIQSTIHKRKTYFNLTLIYVMEVVIAGPLKKRLGIFFLTKT